MKVTLFMAISLNGLIADENGLEEFLSHTNWNSFVEKATEFGNFVVGRKTYQAVKDWGEGYGFDDFKNLDRVILTRDQASKITHDYTVAHSPEEALSKLSERGHVRALVTGGSEVNSAFMEANLVDEIILNIEPVVVGEGIPLFGTSNFLSRLELQNTKTLENGILQVHYFVKK